ncbi:MAG: hypothetical protein CSA11_02555 [Chloroflexi bacterium]|nr:MAG: hypothetical protein CSA11_02555 [Chloroflexota bacterium]
MTVIFAILSFPGRDSIENTQFMLLTYGEVLSPPFAGWIATRLLLGDPYREMLFCSPTPIWHLIIKRLTILFSVILFSWSALLLFLSPDLYQNISIDSIGQMFLGSLSTNLVFIGIGTWGAIRFRSAASGTIVVVSIWAIGLLFDSMLLQISFGHIIHPFLTLKAPDSEFWIVNLITLCFLTTLLLFLSHRLVKNEERLLPVGEAEEII